MRLITLITFLLALNLVTPLGLSFLLKVRPRWEPPIRYEVSQRVVLKVYFSEDFSEMVFKDVLRTSYRYLPRD